MSEEKQLMTSALKVGVEENEGRSRRRMGMSRRERRRCNLRVKMVVVEETVEANLQKVASSRWPGTPAIHN
jgi:hypothetical protein